MKKSTKKGWGALLVFPFIIFSCFILKKKYKERMKSSPKIQQMIKKKKNLTRAER